MRGLRVRVRAAAGTFGVGVRWGGEIGLLSPPAILEMLLLLGGFDPPAILAFAAGVTQPSCRGLPPTLLQISVLLLGSWGGGSNRGLVHAGVFRAAAGIGQGCLC